MKCVTSRVELRVAVAEARHAGRRIAFVPTMGFLHEGHLRLFDVGRQHGDVLVASVFVNPLQFGAGEDFERYPRDMARDTGLAAGRGVDVLFTPDASEMYPSGGSRVLIAAPDLEDRLCGRFRPGHFRGVLTVVAKLFHLVEPDAAVFGQKDFQQAMLIRRMVLDLDFAIDVVVAPTVRDPDGLALSSRNARLAPEQRRAALSIWRGLRAAQGAFNAGERSGKQLAGIAAAAVAVEPRMELQYAETVDPATLQPADSAEAGSVIAVAAFAGDTRLIDNHVLT
jgi:pantoate--beta-alanine ligase